MIERCPCCNARLKQSITCSRCQADLNNLINCEKSAQYWLSLAIQSLLEHKIEQSSLAINQSLALNTTKAAMVFRHFLIYQQSHAVIDLLTQSQLLSAKKTLYNVRMLIPKSKQLQQLDNFIDYLLVKDA